MAMMNDCSNPSRMNDFSRPRRMSASAFAILFMKSLSEYAGTVFFLVAFLAYKSVGGRSLTEILLSIAAIAAAVGYESQGKFTRAFKDVTGQLTTEYRREHRG